MKSLLLKMVVLVYTNWGKNTIPNCKKMMRSLHCVQKRKTALVFFLEIEYNIETNEYQRFSCYSLKKGRVP